MKTKIIRADLSKNGFSVSYDQKKFLQTYPAVVWQKFPEQLKLAIA